jgi:hypothetical protein
MARPRNGEPLPLSLNIRAYRIGEAVLAYQTSGEQVRRLVDLILDSLVGSKFPQIAKTIDAYRDELDLRTLGDEPEPETGQDERGEPEPADIPEPAESLA